MSPEGTAPPLIAPPQEEEPALVLYLLFCFIMPEPAFSFAHLRKNIWENLIDDIQKIGYTDGRTGNRKRLSRGSGRLCRSQFFFCVNRIQNIHRRQLIFEMVYDRPDNISISVSVPANANENIGTSCILSFRICIVDFNGSFSFLAMAASMYSSLKRVLYLISC